MEQIEKWNWGRIAAMETAAHSLPSDSLELHAEIIRLRDCVVDMQQVIAQRDEKIQHLLEKILLLTRQRFGSSSDRISPDQLGLFDEAELEAEIAAVEQQIAPLVEAPIPAAETAPPAPRAKPVRKPLPEHLPRVDRLIDLAPEEKQALGEDYGLIGYDVSEQLAIIPRQPYVIRNLRAKYAPLRPELAGGEEGVIIAPRAAQILPKSMAHSSLLADIAVAKYADALPLYRQEQIFARDGLELSRQTTCAWMVALDEPLTPLMAAMKALLGQDRVLHIDETRVQVLNEPGRAATQQSFMWVYRGGSPMRPVILFDYSQTRGGAAPRAFLHGLALEHVYLVTDAYAVYSPLALELGMLDHATCWAHVRRKFVEAAAGRSHAAAAHQMVGLIGKLYTLERSFKDLSPEGRKRERELHSRPVLEAIKAWLDETVVRVLPKSLLGKAIAYTLGIWTQLTTFLQNGHIPIDNNPAENAIRPFVIGRRNWLFSATPRGAKASATLYSLIESAKANGLEPRAYLAYLFEHLPLAKTPEDIAALLPQRLTPADIVPPPVHLKLATHSPP
jgi:transposase